MVSEANHNLKVGTSSRQILSIALPISISIFIPQINFATNNIFLGGLGEHALSAAGITGVYYLIFATVGFALNNGLQALLARRSGAERPEEIGTLFSQASYISLAFAITGILFTYLVTPSLMRIFLNSTELQQQCISFLKIRIIGLPFLYLYLMRNALLVGTNQSKYLMIGALAETIANIFFDYGLIYGKFGLPHLEFNGAAVASIIAEVTGMMVVMLVIRLQGTSKRFGLKTFMPFNKKSSKLLLVQSSPLIFQHAISIISWEFFYILIEHHGARDLAISNTMRNLFGLCGIFTWAFAATSNTMVSNIIGQGKQHMVMGLVKKIAIINSCIALALCLLLNICPQLFLAIFRQQDTFVQQAIPVVRVVSIAVLMMSLGAVWLNSVTGTGNTKINLAIEVIAIIVYCIYSYVVLEVLRLPITIGWMSEWFYWIILLCLSYFYMRSGKWKGKVI